MLEDKVAIITGGSRGIGFAIAKQLAGAGYNLAIFATSPYKNVERNIVNLEGFGKKVLYIQGDLKDSKSRDILVSRVLNEFGRIDVLINNAGVAPKIRTDILETTEKSFDFVVDTNLKGTYFLSQRVSKEMIKIAAEKKDCSPIIINIASVSSYASSILRGEYCISKAGISMITKLFADRLAEYGINVYEIRPGIINTDMTNRVKDKYDNLIDEGLTPIKRWGQPGDVANAVMVLCSGLLAFSTGEVINVDGGFHLRRL